jgi:hypothetical protein
MRISPSRNLTPAAPVQARAFDGCHAESVRRGNVVRFQLGRGSRVLSPEIEEGETTMIGLLVGAVLGGWAVWRWRGQMERYVGDFRALRQKAVDAAQQGAARVTQTLQSTAETIRPPSRSSNDSDRASGRRDS